MRRILACCLALLLLLGAVPFAAAENAAATQADPVYRDENVTVTVESISVSGTAVNAGFRVSCPEDRSCTLFAKVSEEMMTEEDVFVLLKKMKNLGAGNIMYHCKPGESILCEFVWDLEDEWDYSIVSALDHIPSVSITVEPTCVSVPLQTDRFPKAAGFTMLEFKGDILLENYVIPDEGFTREELNDLFLGAFSLQFTKGE